MVPSKSSIDLGLTAQVMTKINSKLPSFISLMWEHLSRQAAPFLGADREFGPASRWWGKDRDGNLLEIDMISESEDKKTLLIGEAKWTDEINIKKESKILAEKVSRLPFTKGKEVITALFVKKKPDVSTGNTLIFGPEDVVGVTG